MGGCLSVAARIVSAADADADARTRAVLYREKVVPFLKKYCTECHGRKTSEAEINLEQYASLDKILEDRGVWSKVLIKSRSSEMPPKESVQPSGDERKMVVQWLDGVLNDIDCGKVADPGRVTIRRLNRHEYRNTIRELVGVDFEPALDFPGDDVGYGFDNIGDVLSLPTILMEKYLAAADEITRKAIITTGLEAMLVPKTPAASIKSADGTPYGGGARMLTSSGEVGLEIEIPVEGEYEFRVVAYGQQAGPDPAHGISTRWQGRGNR